MTKKTMKMSSLLSLFFCILVCIATLTIATISAFFANAQITGTIIFSGDIRIEITNTDGYSPTLNNTLVLYTNMQVDYDNSTLLFANANNDATFASPNCKFSISGEGKAFISLKISLVFTPDSTKLNPSDFATINNWAIKANFNENNFIPVEMDIYDTQTTYASQESYYSRSDATNSFLNSIGTNTRMIVSAPYIETISATQYSMNHNLFIFGNDIYPSETRLELSQNETIDFMIPDILSSLTYDPLNVTNMQGEWRFEIKLTGSMWKDYTV